MEERGYWHRVRSRAWSETKTVWSAYRWWLSIAPGCFGVTLALAWRGWIGLVSVGYVLGNAIGATIVAWGGCYIISLWRSPRLLDDDRAQRVSDLETERNNALAKIATLQAASAIDPREQHRRDVVRQKLHQFNPEERRLLRFLVDNGKVRDTQLMNCGVDRTTMLEALNKGRRVGLIHDDLNRIGAPESSFINPELSDALHFVLYEGGALDSR